MKISNSIRELFNLQEAINLKLSNKVKLLLGENKKDNWFYKSRVKQLESFAQKLETGRFKPDALEDFFACTIVVENKQAINEALALVERFCIIHRRKPLNEHETHKSPDLFSFDDLRLYAKLKPSETGPPSPLNDVLFEIQIKTFLQHAWTIATHDLIYKGESLSWGKARLAYQIKAMLEHAEISIDQVDVVAGSTALSVTDKTISSLNEVITWIKSSWEKELLPFDIVRLSQSVQGVMTALKLNFEELKEAVKADTENGLGTASKNLSPYEIIVKAISNNKNEKFLAFANNAKSKFKVLITPEMELSLPPGFSITNLLFVKQHRAPDNIELRVTSTSEQEKKLVKKHLRKTKLVNKRRKN